MSDIRAGDVVVCVDDDCGGHSEGFSGILQTGRYYTVAAMIDGPFPECRGPGLLLVEVSRNLSALGWCAYRFRKIEAPKTELSERIRKCRPVPAKVEETALDRLAARLGEGRMSPEAMVDLGIITDRDAAYGRMIEASIARDDAGYERAKAEFWGRGL